MIISEQLDYFRLVRESRNIDIAACTTTVRVAVLGDFATQQFIQIFRTLAARNGINLEIYDPGYDVIEMEVLDSESGLYKFCPQFILILQAAEKLKQKFYHAHNQTAFAEEHVGKLTQLWACLQKRCTAQIIQANYVQPSERAFGNYESKVPRSLGSAVAAINFRMIEEARKTKDVLLLDTDHLAAEVGRSNWSDPRLWAIAKSPCNLKFLPLLVKQVLDIIGTGVGKLTKCVILDLDNTLWGGTIGDDGLSGIVLGGFDEGEVFVAFQEFLLQLRKRGIILAVVSKNDYANAILPFREHPEMVLKETDISVFVANWENKADNIRRVRETLNIGFDSIVFLDDNPFERNLVREFLPELIVPELPEDPAGYISAVADLNLFETTTISELDADRTQQYREQGQREELKAAYSDINDYLRSLKMVIRLERFNQENLARIAQLIQRSNQFNLTTRRYSTAVCEKYISDDFVIPLSFSVADRFGDYGLIGVTILRIKELELDIDEFLMSCRVLQRGVEAYVMNSIFDIARKLNLAHVRGHHIPTEKNGMVKHFYSRFGFSQVLETADGVSDWSLAVSEYKTCSVFLSNDVPLNLSSVATKALFANAE